MDANPLRLFQITSPYYSAGLEVRDGVVYKAAPILHWTIGKEWGDVEDYFRRKKFNIYEMP